MNAWDAIQKSLNTIEAKLSEEISISSLADAVGLSPFYFQRLFKQLVKKTVNEYIKLRRLSKAAALLQENHQRIMDIALDCGFSNHANFTRAFVETFEITPEEYRNNKVILNQFVKPNLTISHLNIEELTPLVADGVIVEISRRTLLEPRVFAGIQHVLPESEMSDGLTTGVSAAGSMWQIFHDQKMRFPHPLSDRKELGVLTKSKSQQGCCTYFTGIEIAANEIDDKCPVFTLLNGEYVICKIEAETFSELVESALFKAYSFMNSWMKQHQYSYSSYIAELYIEANADACTMELWIPTKSLARHFELRKTKIWDKNNGSVKPSLEEIDDFVESNLWIELRQHIESDYQSLPTLEYSKCSAQPGWNVKYKKAGRSLCTLYPMRGFFIALIVIGQREQAEFEKNLPLFSSYLQLLYKTTESGMGQKWLMINVNDSAVLEDVKRCISIRREKKPNVVRKNAKHLEN